MVRTAEHEGAWDVRTALGSLELGVDIAVPADGGGDLVVVTADGANWRFVVTALKRIAAADVARLTRSPARPPLLPLAVADRIVPAARQALTDAGWAWLDRRGHLRLRAGPLSVDADVPPLLDDVSPTGRAALDTTVGLDVAVALLAQPGTRLSVRAMVAFTGRSLAAVHQALQSLTAEGLLRPGGPPLVPELFWEAAARWQPVPAGLAGLPAAGNESRTSQIALGLDDMDAPGWALRADLAADAFGASVVAGDHPPDFYVPNPRILRVARQLYGDAPLDGAQSATVALSPVRWVCSRRVDPTTLGRDGHLSEFGHVHPVIAALDLAAAGRGREILDEWEPPAPYRRVW